MSSFVPEWMRRAVAAEALGLADSYTVRRNFTMAATGFTPRRMGNVTRSLIAQKGFWIPQIYQSDAVRRIVELVAGEPVSWCPYQPEQYVITRLERGGDTHGWHWDDYRFALVWVAECPDQCDGGYVECVPATFWNKCDPGVHRILASREVHRLAVGAGEVYLMRADSTMHRVHPIRAGRRTIVNMAFAGRDELCRTTSHETMDALWSIPEM
ncbi:hypothetical protein OG804_15040 [Nocardia sp. NBC_00416]